MQEEPLAPLLAPRRWRGLIAGAYLLLAAAVVVDLTTGPDTTVSPVLAAAPALAGAGSRSAKVPLIAGAVAAAVVGLLTVLNQDVAAPVHAAALAAVVSVALAASANVLLVSARERELQQIRSVAEAAQRALLRPVPARVGPLRLAVRYVAAADGARIGGDLYEVLETEFGVRVLLGDVEGKGLAAVETAADVLGVFRDAARTEADLARVAERLDGALAMSSVDGRFVTAVLVGVPDAPAPAQLVNCGHPAPLLLDHDGGVRELKPERYAPPLGLLGLTGGRYRARELELRRGDQLLLYTDGVSEARNGEDTFYPVAERVAAMPGSDPDALLDHLLADIRAHTGGGATDDSALLALRLEA